MPELSQFQQQKALISFYVTPSVTLIFWFDETTETPLVDYIEIEQSEIAEVAAEIQRLFLRERVNPKRPERTINMDWLPPFAQKLLRPLAERLSRYRALVVAPHADLHLIPFHLLTGADGLPLGLTHVITYVPSLSLYALLLSRSTETADLTLPSLCLATAAEGEDAAVQNAFAANPRTFAEKTGGLFQEGIAANKLLLKGLGQLASSLYISCHGLFDSQDALESALLLSDGKTLPPRSQVDANPTDIATQMIPYSISVSDILSLRLQASLVVLDACRSGNQSFVYGDEATGFPTAFLLAGSSAVIASNWNVDWRAGDVFFRQLLERWESGPPHVEVDKTDQGRNEDVVHPALPNARPGGLARPGGSESSTLGEAMLSARQRVYQDYPHPFHWAVFSLFGNDLLRFRPV